MGQRAYIRLGTGPHGLTTYHSPPAATHPPRVAAGPVSTVRPHPIAWAVALDLAGGDPHRLRVGHDGSVEVVNRPTRGTSGVSTTSGRGLGPGGDQ